MTQQYTMIVPSLLAPSVRKFSSILHPGCVGMFQTKLRLKGTIPTTHYVSAGPPPEIFVHGIMNPDKLDINDVKAKLPKEITDDPDVQAMTTPRLQLAISKCFISDGFYTYTDEQGNRVTIEETPLAFIDRMGFEIVPKVI